MENRFDYNEQTLTSTHNAVCIENYQMINFTVAHGRQTWTYAVYSGRFIQIETEKELIGSLQLSATFTITASKLTSVYLRNRLNDVTNPFISLN